MINERQLVSVNQRQLVSEAKIRLRGVEKQIRDFSNEKWGLEKFIRTAEYVSAKKKKGVSKKWVLKMAESQRRKQTAVKDGSATPEETGKSDDRVKIHPWRISRAIVKR